MPGLSILGIQWHQGIKIRVSTPNGYFMPTSVQMTIMQLNVAQCTRVHRHSQAIQRCSHRCRPNEWTSSVALCATYVRFISKDTNVTIFWCPMMLHYSDISIQWMPGMPKLASQRDFLTPTNGNPVSIFLYMLTRNLKRFSYLATRNMWKIELKHLIMNRKPLHKT